MTLLAGGRIVTRAAVHDPGWIETHDGVIVAVGAGSPPEPADHDLGGAWVLPGFVDLHVHGGGGHDVARSPDDMAAAVEFHRAHGTTGTLVSLVTAPVEDLTEQLRWAAALAASSPRVLGAHLEGPFLASHRCGAQNPRHLLPADPDTFARLLEAGRGALRMITVAPELPGGLDLIRAARAAGLLVAIGHSDATYDEALAATAVGASVATHLFNGMPPLHHRDPGLVGAAVDAGLACELINDGQHIHPAVIRLVAAAMPDRLVLITDAIDATGMPDGTTVLGGQEVTVADGVARLSRTGALAGSTLTMDEAVRRSVVDVGLDVRIVAAAAATTPARLLGIGDRRGEIRAGLAADLVLLDEELRLQRVMLAGS